MTTLLLDLDVNMVERTELDEVFKEQVVQLQHADDAEVLKVGKLVGAQAIVVGEVQQGERAEGDQISRVSLALRMIDVESGIVLFNGQGYGSDATADDPESLARVITNRILTRFGSQTGLLGSGRIGVNWELQESADGRFYLVRELRGGLPADLPLPARANWMGGRVGNRHRDRRRRRAGRRRGRRPPTPGGAGPRSGRPVAARGGRPGSRGAHGSVGRASTPGFVSRASASRAEPPTVNASASTSEAMHQARSAGQVNDACGTSTGHPGRGGRAGQVPASEAAPTNSR